MDVLTCFGELQGVAPPGLARDEAAATTVVTTFKAIQFRSAELNRCKGKGIHARTLNMAQSRKPTTPERGLSSQHLQPTCRESPCDAGVRFSAKSDTGF